jgi:hypothetical protein
LSRNGIERRPGIGSDLEGPRIRLAARAAAGLVAILVQKVVDNDQLTFSE